MRFPSQMRLAAWSPVFWAVLLGTPGASAAAADRQQAQAQLLDHAEYPCVNCFFASSQHYFCFAADNQILIGYQKSSVMNFQDSSKNYLTTIHHGWETWTAPGQAIPIRYDEQHIWVRREDAKPERHGFWGHMRALGSPISRANSGTVKLKRSSLREIFLNNDRCRGTAH